MNKEQTLDWLHSVWGNFSFRKRFPVWDSFHCQRSDEVVQRILANNEICSEYRILFEKYSQITTMNNVSKSSRLHMIGNCKWRIVTDRRSKGYDHFYVEFKDNIPTNRQKCKKCPHILQCKSTTTTSMMNKWEICSTKENNISNQSDIVDAIQIQRTSFSQFHYGQFITSPLQQSQIPKL